MERIEKAWGYEEVMVNNELYCNKRLVVRAGHRTSLHYHSKKDETFYIEGGQGDLLLALCDPVGGIIIDDRIDLRRGVTIRVRPGRIHQFNNAMKYIDLVILEVSTHHDDADSHRLQVGGRITQEDRDGEEASNKD